MVSSENMKEQNREDVEHYTRASDDDTSSRHVNAAEESKRDGESAGSSRLGRIVTAVLTRGAWRSERKPSEGEDVKDPHFEEWMTLAEPRAIAETLESLKSVSLRPLISIVMPVFNTNPKHLECAVGSVKNQIYTNWELCIADDASTDPQTIALLREIETSDERIRVVWREENGHISRASNSAIEIAEGDFVGFLDHDDELSTHTLGSVVLWLSEHPEADLLYSDEDKIDRHGHRFEPFFKGDFDPLLLLSKNYINHFTVIRRSVLLESQGFREGYEGAQDWDLFLRITEAIGPDKIEHIPMDLYHWRVSENSTSSFLGAKEYARSAGARAVSDHLHRTGREAAVETDPVHGYHRILWKLPNPLPRVDIIIPTRDGATFEHCMRTLLDVTDYPDMHIVVVDNGSEDPEFLRSLANFENLSQVSVIRDDRPFNYSALNNRAVSQSSAELICLLNDDIEIISSDWLSEMVSQIIQPGVGAVGAKLHYPDGTIQHAGVVLGIGGLADHVFKNVDSTNTSYFDYLNCARSISCVTAACMMVRRELWDIVGGLDEEHLAVAFNDVDLCIRIRATGWRIVWTPHAQLIHHESVSRGYDTTPENAERFRKELLYMRKTWRNILKNDPYYNPNLSIEATDYRSAKTVRRQYVDNLELLRGERLFAGEHIVSRSGNFQALMQDDGGFQILDTQTSEIIWKIDTAPFGDHLAFQFDGNIVVYSAVMEALWSSNIFFQDPDKLVLTDTGAIHALNTSGDICWRSGAEVRH
jgi:O-antigen biosynthesis protein